MLKGFLRKHAALPGQFVDEPGIAAGRRLVFSEQTALLSRYVDAWQAADAAGLVALLREDALITMPPLPLSTSISWWAALSNIC